MSWPASLSQPPHRARIALAVKPGPPPTTALGACRLDRALGTVATFLLDSSSVTIIILIAIVDAGSLSLGQALPVILGSNNGTTLSSQIFALQFDDYVPIALLLGLLLAFLQKSER
jgi:Na+/Pi-cotransporter